MHAIDTEMKEDWIAPGAGTALGCIAATLLVMSAGVMVAFVWAWTGAHCEPVPQCQSDSTWRGLLELALLLSLAATLGFAVRWVAKAVACSCPDRLLVSTTISTVVMLLLVWAAYESFVFAITHVS